MSAVTQQTTQQTIDRLAGFDASSTLAAVRGVVQDPTANTTLSVLVLAIAVLAVMIVVLLVLAIATPTRKKVVKVRTYRGARPEGRPAQVAPAARPAAPPAEPSRFTKFLTSTGFLVGLTVVAVIGAYVSTGTDYYCAKTCHANTKPVQSAQKAGHTTCAGCHEVGGPLGVPANLTSRSRMIVAYAVHGMPKLIRATMDSDECLRCHRDVDGTPTKSAQGLVMSHTEVIDGGMQCTLCHERSGHVALSTSVPMAECLPCHDAKTASAECETCHGQSPSAKVVVRTDSEGKPTGGDFVYPAVRAANRECGGCHDQEQECDTCHGIRMPHSRDFKEGSHARPAAFDSKLRCWKCHDPQWCSNGGCHTSAFSPADGSTTHGPAWKQEHKAAAWDAGCVCHSGRTTRDYPICDRCHAENRSLLPVRR